MKWLHVCVHMCGEYTYNGVKTSVCGICICVTTGSQVCTSVNTLVHASTVLVCVCAHEAHSTQHSHNFNTSASVVCGS